MLVRVTSLLEFRLRKANTTLRTQIAPDLPPLAVAPHALEQILINLLANALDAVTGAAQPVVQVRARVLAENPRFAIVEVADNGAGVAKAVRNRLFESFFTTKGEEQGTGLGLAVSREIARSAGGDLARARRTRRLERARGHGVSADAAGLAGALSAARGGPRWRSGRRAWRAVDGADRPRRRAGDARAGHDDHA